MTYIPSEIVPFIVEFLSPLDMAVVAQVNTSWRDVVYSNACWKRMTEKIWEIKPDSSLEFYHGLEIPSRARHMGEPTELCFADWLFLLVRSNHHTSVPFCILESSDYKDYIHYFKQLWKTLRCPCVHTTHYKWYDVYKGRHYLAKMSPSDQQRVFYRHCKFTTQYENIDTNPYCFWLKTHIRDSLVGYTYPRTDVADIVPRSNHPADVILAKQKTHENRRLHTLFRHRQSIVEQFETSIAHLRCYGKQCFNKKILPWEKLFPPSE